MNEGQLELFLKLVHIDYSLSSEQIAVLRARMLADESEFERVWEAYKLKARKTRKGVDGFQSVLKELLS